MAVRSNSFTSKSMSEDRYCLPSTTDRGSACAGAGLSLDFDGFDLPLNNEVHISVEIINLFNICIHLDVSIPRYVL